MGLSAIGDVFLDQTLPLIRGVYLNSKVRYPAWLNPLLFSTPYSSPRSPCIPIWLDDLPLENALSFPKYAFHMFQSWLFNDVCPTWYELWHSDPLHFASSVSKSFTRSAFVLANSSRSTPTNSWISSLRPSLARISLPSRLRSHNKKPCLLPLRKRNWLLWSMKMTTSLENWTKRKWRKSASPSNRFLLSLISFHSPLLFSPIFICSSPLSTNRLLPFLVKKSIQVCSVSMRFQVIGLCELLPSLPSRGFAGIASLSMSSLLTVSYFSIRFNLEEYSNVVSCFIQGIELVDSEICRTYHCYCIRRFGLNARSYWSQARYLNIKNTVADEGWGLDVLEKIKENIRICSNRIAFQVR